MGDRDGCAESDADTDAVVDADVGEVDEDADVDADVREDGGADEDAVVAVADTAAGDCGGEMRRASNSAIVTLGLGEADHERTAVSKAWYGVSVKKQNTNQCKRRGNTPV